MIDTDTSNLGFARILGGLAELEVHVGIRRSNPVFAGTNYHRAPRGYITVQTSARGKVRGERDISVKGLRDLARDLADYADVLDAWQTADAIEAEQRAELAS